LSSGKRLDLSKLKEIGQRTYKEQAIWFLNAFWANPSAKEPRFADGMDDPEIVWNYFRMCVELDPNGEEGKELDEVLAHRLLEKLEKALTVVEMREVMRKVDVDFNKYVSLLEFCVYKFKADWRVMVGKDGVEAQGGPEMTQQMNEIQALVDEASAQLAECQRLAAEALEAERHAREEEKHAVAEEARAVEAEAAARDAEEVFIQAEAEAQAAEDEQRAEEEKVATAVADLKAMEQAHEDRLVYLEGQSKRTSVGIVKRGKAASEFHQLRATETVGMREARINMEAALRRQKKVTELAALARARAQAARAPFKKATEEAEAARKDAEEARANATAAAEEAEAARKEADEAVETSMAAYREAEAALDEFREKFKTVNQGRIWWMDRELEFAKQFMSKRQLQALEG